LNRFTKYHFFLTKIAALQQLKSAAKSGILKLYEPATPRSKYSRTDKAFAAALVLLHRQWIACVRRCYVHYDATVIRWLAILWLGICVVALVLALIGVVRFILSYKRDTGKPKN
jgi:hypothetical protein